MLIAVGREHAMQASAVHPRFGYQGGQAGNKVERLEDDVSRPIAVRGLQFVTHVAIAGQRQTLLRDGRPAELPA